jgi:hypothetical protein
VLKAIVDADDLDAVVDRFNRSRMDNPVDAGRRAATDKDAHALCGAVGVHDKNLLLGPIRPVPLTAEL